MTDPLFAPATARLRKAVWLFSPPIPSENPVREALNFLRMSASKHQEDRSFIDVVNYEHVVMSSGYDQLISIEKKSICFLFFYERQGYFYLFIYFLKASSS